MFNPLKIIGTIGEIIQTPLKAYSERKTITAKAKIEVENLYAQAKVATAMAAVERAKAGDVIQADYDMRAQNAMKFTWKDEVLLLPVVIPMFMCFIPKFQGAAVKGFEIFNSLPLWYRILVLAIYASVYGLRWAIEPILNKWNK